MSDKTRFDPLKIIRADIRRERNKRRPMWVKVILRYVRVSTALCLLPFWIILFAIAMVLSLEKDQPWFDVLIDRFIDWLDQ